MTGVRWVIILLSFVDHYFGHWGSTRLVGLRQFILRAVIGAGSQLEAQLGGDWGATMWPLHDWDFSEYSCWILRGRK